MRLVAFNIDELHFMVTGCFATADRRRPTARLRDQAQRATQQREHDQYVALGRKLSGVLQQAETTIATGIAITGQQPPPIPPNDKPEAPRLVTLSVAELHVLYFSMGAAVDRIEALLRAYKAQVRPRGKDEYVQRTQAELRACQRLRKQIDRLYYSARKNTAVNVAVE
jgi:hypothetical protein